ncbi:MAG TPA: hypothetical protein VF437_07895, partial [Verrucomicrobiae bacterium]
MKYPPVTGQIFVNCGSSEVIIDGDPQGLRSLAKLCLALANVDQKKIKGLPDQGAREHIHLNPGTHLGNNSIRLVLGRAEDKTGELNPDYEPRTSKSANVG